MRVRLRRVGVTYSLWVLSFVCVIGCATGYQRRMFLSGYRDLPIRDDIHWVTFHGNGHTSEDRAADFALLRSAEVALERGCPFFVILENETHSDVSTRTSPMVTQTVGNIDSFGNVNATSFTSGGSTHVRRMPRSHMVVRILKERPDDDGDLVYDAVQIRRRLRAQYNLDQPKPNPKRSEDRPITVSESKKVAKTNPAEPQRLDGF